MSNMDQGRRPGLEEGSLKASQLQQQLEREGQAEEPLRGLEGVHRPWPVLCGHGVQIADLKTDQQAVELILQGHEDRVDEDQDREGRLEERAFHEVPQGRAVDIEEPLVGMPVSVDQRPATQMPSPSHLACHGLEIGSLTEQN